MATADEGGRQPFNELTAALLNTGIPGTQKPECAKPNVPAVRTSHEKHFTALRADSLMAGETNAGQAGSADPGHKLSVFCRMRPFTAAELIRGERRAFFLSSGQSLTQKDVHHHARHEHAMEHDITGFDSVFESATTSSGAEFAAVFQPLIDAVFNGHSGALLLHGASGSGKTFALMHSLNRLVGAVMSRCHDREGPPLSVHVTALQLCGETVYQLPSGTTLHMDGAGSLREDAFKYVGTIEGAMATLRQALRSSGSVAKATNGHVLVGIRVDGQATLWLCELNATLSKSTCRKVSTSSSLLHLGRCLDARAWNARHPFATPKIVPFRLSKISKLLRAALGNGGRVAMLLCVAPGVSSQNATLATLQHEVVSASGVGVFALATRRFLGAGRRRTQAGSAPVSPRQPAVPVGGGRGDLLHSAWQRLLNRRMRHSRLVQLFCGWRRAVQSARDDSLSLHLLCVRQQIAHSSDPLEKAALLKMVATNVADGHICGLLGTAAEEIEKLANTTPLCTTEFSVDDDNRFSLSLQHIEAELGKLETTLAHLPDLHSLNDIHHVEPEVEALQVSEMEQNHGGKDRDKVVKPPPPFQDTWSPLSKPEWERDEETDQCLCCKRDFTFWRRRHHCRACGYCTCGSCSESRQRLPWSGNSAERVCDWCVRARATF